MDVIRTPEEEIQEIDIQIAKIDEILAGQIEPSMPDVSGFDLEHPESAAKVQELTDNFNASHALWVEQVSFWNEKKELHLARKSELQSE